MTLYEDMLEELIQYIDSRFPGLGKVVETQIAVRNMIKYRINQECYALIYKGDPGTRKSMSLRISNDPYLYVFRDTFTEKAFITNVGNATKSELENMDLLPQLTDKILVVKDLTTLFTKPEDELRQTLGVLATVLDGDGYSVHTGMYGNREYKGRTAFGLLGGTTSPKRYFWDAITLIGSKVLFYDMPTQPANFVPEGDKNAKIQECNSKVQEFYSFFDKNYSSELLTGEDDLEVINCITTLGLFLSKSRGREETGVDDGMIDVSFEEPSRNVKNLMMLGKAICLTKGKNGITKDCLPVLQHIVMSSIPKSRAKLVSLFLKAESPVTIEELCYELNLDDSKVRKIVSKLILFELIEDSTTESNFGRPPKGHKLKDKFKQALTIRAEELTLCSPL